jgi:hypothetical protein
MRSIGWNTGFHPTHCSIHPGATGARKKIHEVRNTARRQQHPHRRRAARMARGP